MLGVSEGDQLFSAMKISISFLMLKDYTVGADLCVLSTDV
jgi:hypothetical protein